MTVLRIKKNKLLLSSYEFGFALFIGVLVIYPYLFLLNIFLPSSLPIGKNTYILIITAIIALCFLLGWKKILSKLGAGTVYFIITLILLIIAVRYWLYGEGIDKIFLYRIILTPLLYCGVAYHYLRQKEKKEIVKKIIFYSCLVQAVFGLVHTYLFPEVLLGLSSDEPLKIVARGMGGLRESGTLMASSLYANFVLLGGFLLISSYKKWRLPRFVEYAIMFIFTWGTVISGSRWPFIIIVLLFMLYLKKLFSSKKILSILLIILLLGFFLPNIFIYMTHKLTMHPISVRLAKYHLALVSLLETPSSFLIGPFMGRTNTGVETTSFSDNSFLLLMLTFGVPFICLFLFLFFHIISKTIAINKNYFILFYFLITLFVTNSILWDIWLFYFFVTLYSLQLQPCALSNLHKKTDLGAHIKLQ